MRDDEHYVRRAREGGREAFEKLVELHQRRLHAFVARLVGVGDTAEEIVQSAFVRAWTELPGFEGRSSFRTWLHQIALNLCRTRARQEKTRGEVPLPPEEADANAGRPQLLGAGLAARVESLPPRQREVLLLRVFVELPFRDVARLCGISVNAAKVSYHHAIRRLREELREEDR